MSKTVLTTIDLKMYSPSLVSLLNLHMPDGKTLFGNETLSIGPGKRSLEVLSVTISDQDSGVVNPEIMEDAIENTEKVSLEDDDVSKHICGIIALAAITRNALSSASWQFVEWFVLKYAAAFSEGEINLGTELTREFVIEQGIGRISAYRNERITRWTDKGIACNTDVACTDTLHLVDEDSGVKLPTVYPIIVVGQVIFFNQHFPISYMAVSHSHSSDEDAPVVCGAFIFESLGTATVKQRGPSAEVLYDGVRYHADALGVQPV